MGPIAPNLFQGHVLSYSVESTPGWFVWGAPPLRTGAIIKIRKEQLRIGAKFWLRGEYLVYIVNIFGGV
jgi:hypothetical protein